MRVVFDTNVILDHLLDRQPYAAAAEHLFTQAELGHFRGALCATTLMTIDYLVKKAAGAATARDAVRLLLRILEVASVHDRVIRSGLDSRFRDFEDAVLHEAALAYGAEAIVTRITRDFQH